MSGVETDAWRWMIGVEAIPAIIYTLMVLGVPKSPRWLLTKNNDRAEAAKTLALIDPQADVESQMDAILADDASHAKNETIFLGKYRFLLILAFLIFFFFNLGHSFLCRLRLLDLPRTTLLCIF